MDTLNKFELDSDREVMKSDHNDMKEAETPELANSVDLEAANELKSRFLQIVAHDLKNPLGVIEGIADLLVEEQENPELVAKYARHISETTRRMMNIVTTLLESDLIKDTGGLLEMASVDFGELAMDVVIDNRVLAGKKRQKLEYFYEPGCRVVGDQRQMREIIENLVGNAIKYSAWGGKITVMVKRVEKGTPDLPVTKVQLKVRDEGPGLTKEETTAVFDHFKISGAQPTGGETSSGIGLSVVKQFVKFHDGRIWAESDGKGKGASFLVEFPFVPTSSR